MVIGNRPADHEVLQMIGQEKMAVKRPSTPEAAPVRSRPSRKVEVQSWTLSVSIIKH